MASSSRVMFVSDLKDVKLPQPSVAIVDRVLPKYIISRFSNVIPVEGGEKLKRLQSLEELANRVLETTQDRSMTLVAVGGGSVGDTVGLLASLLWRGVSLVHVPTTLLAMVDSAHGGKTAVNLEKTKNQLGTFYPAEQIWIVRSILERLSEPLQKEGMIELFKALLLGEPKLAKRYIEDGWSALPLWETLQKAIAVKQKIVAKDPFETRGKREQLNLGHTLGHALEASTGLSHGQSVAWGLAAALVLSENIGLSKTKAILEFLRPMLRCPLNWPSPEALEEKMKKDKKQKKGEFHSILLRKLGEPKIAVDVSPRQWTESLAEVRKRLDLT